MNEKRNGQLEARAWPREYVPKSRVISLVTQTSKQVCTLSWIGIQLRNLEIYFTSNVCIIVLPATEAHRLKIAVVLEDGYGVIDSRVALKKYMAG